MAEEHQVEEGEIYDDTHADIDEKLESLSGDCIKEFERGVSFDNLGPKFGVYGTFLPTYQRLPSILCGPTTPQKLVTSRVTLSANKKLVPKNDQKAVDRVASHKPDQFSEGKKKLTERQPSEPPVSPFIIEGDWIHYDKCRKWRLLPYGTKPEQLSESWICSMLDWLPGMNRCDISEEDTTRALHELYRIHILNNLQNSVGKGSVDVKAHNGREVPIKKRKLREHDYLTTLQCNGNDSGDSDANAFEREISGEFRKQKKSKVFQTEKREESRAKGTVTRMIPGIKDSPPIDRSTEEREHQKKYRVTRQSEEEFGVIRKQVCKFPLKKAFGYGKEARTCIAI